MTRPPRLAVVVTAVCVLSASLLSSCVAPAASPAPTSPSSTPPSVSPAATAQPSTATSASAASSPAGNESRDGLGDPYLPDAGGSGYDATNYAVDVAWDPKKLTVSGSTTVTAVATSDLQAVHLDLALHVTSAEVNGQPVNVTPGGGTDRTLTLTSPVPAGQTFTAKLTYSGQPTDHRDADAMPVMTMLGDEMLIAAEPGSAPAWFPSNDHPSDPATYDIRVRVPAGLAALSVGHLVSRDEDADPATATWHWRLERPAATYLTFLAVGEFDLDVGSDAGRPYVYAVSSGLDASRRAEAMAQLKATGSIVRELETRLGDYPWPDLGGVVMTVKAKWTALECAGRPVYLTRGETPPEGIVVHELAHQWFGNNVGLASWRDVVNNEGWATYVQMTLNGNGTASHELDGQLKELWGADTPGAGTLGDPGREQMFSPRIYLKGALALAALRNVVGEDAFATIQRTWAQTQGPRSLRDFHKVAEKASGRDLSTFWKGWYDSPTDPPRTAEYGYPG